MHRRKRRLLMKAAFIALPANGLSIQQALKVRRRIDALGCLGFLNIDRDHPFDICGSPVETNLFASIRWQGRLVGFPDGMIKLLTDVFKYL